MVFQDIPLDATNLLAFWNYLNLPTTFIPIASLLSAYSVIGLVFILVILVAQDVHGKHICFKDTYIQSSERIGF